MWLKPGDLIESPYGARGKVIHITGASVYVAFPRENQEDSIGVFLERQLKKVEAEPADTTQTLEDQQRSNDD